MQDSSPLEHLTSLRRRAVLAGMVPLGLWAAKLLAGRAEAAPSDAAGLAGGASNADALAPGRSAGGARPVPGALTTLHHPPRAKRVIVLTMSGGPSQIETFDEKPTLTARTGEDLPESLRRGRLTTMTADQDRFPLVGSAFPFGSFGQSGLRISGLFPHTAGEADRLCVIRSMQTEAINHDPGITLLQTGVSRPGRPSMGAWVSYAIGAETDNLPSFLVMLSGENRPGDQPLFERLWGSAFLPSRHAGLRLASRGDLVPYLANPPGVSVATRRRMLDDLGALAAASNPDGVTGVGGLGRDARVETTPGLSPVWESRLAAYEAAAAMQTAAPELADLASEDRRTLDAYGPDVLTPGRFARNCLLARRCLERGVRFVQLYHRDWDHHAKLPERMRTQAAETDRATGALLADLAQRGLLEDTLVLWGGEFGRTAFCQGRLTATDYARDHHGRCFSMWLAGGGVRGGHVHGTTDDFSYDVVEGGVTVQDLQATVLHLLGIDHLRLTVPYQGRAMRLTDVSGRVVPDILA